MAKNKFQNKTSNKNTLILYGRHAVIAALKNPERKFTKVLCTQDNSDEVRKLIPSFPLNIVERKEIERVLPQDSVHQGFALYCSELPTYNIEDLLAMAEEKKECHILVLDQVTDPQNIGAIIRSCVAFNAMAIVVQDKNAPKETGSMAKASAGMIELLPIVRVTNLTRALEQLKNIGFWTLGMDGHATTTIDKIKKGGKTAIVMGSEGKGMRRLIEETCDSTVKLNISENAESLNVATAAAIALYEISKG